MTLTIDSLRDRLKGVLLAPEAAIQIDLQGGTDAAVLVPLYVEIVHPPLINHSFNDSYWAVWLPAGASAFNVVLVTRFFDNLPSTTGMAFVVVQHLSPDFRSMMDELLASHTELPVRLVEEGVTFVEVESGGSRAG